MAGPKVLCVRENAGRIGSGEELALNVRISVMAKGKAAGCSEFYQELLAMRTEAFILGKLNVLRKWRLAGAENGKQAAKKAAAVERELEEVGWTGILPGGETQSVFYYALEKGFGNDNFGTLDKALALLLPLHEEGLSAARDGNGNATIYAADGAAVGHAIETRNVIPPKPAGVVGEDGQLLFTQADFLASLKNVTSAENAGSSVAAASMDFQIGLDRAHLRIPPGGLASRVRQLFCEAGLDFSRFVGWLKRELRENYGVSPKAVRKGLADPGSYRFSIRSAGTVLFSLSLLSEIELHCSPVLTARISLEMPSGKLSVKSPNGKTMAGLEEYFHTLGNTEFCY